MLLMLVFAGLAQSLDINSVHDIDEIIEFASGAVENLPEAAAELEAVEIDGKKNFAEIIDYYLINYPHEMVKDEDLEELKSLLGKIDEAWQEFGQKDLGDDDRNQLADLQGTVGEIYRLYVGEKLPIQVAKDTRPTFCQMTVPEHLRLRRVFQAVVLSELRALILALKAGKDSQKLIANAILHSEESIVMNKLAFEDTVDGFRVCDPPEHIRGETFGEFLGLFQGIALNTGHTNGLSKSDKCPNSCGDIENRRINKCYEFRDGFNSKIHCHKKACNGRLFNCMTTGTVQLCELGEGSDRRVPWVQAADERWGNPSFHCDGTNAMIWDINSYMLKCRTCLCVCAEEDPGTNPIRTISLVPQFADIQKNMIVTGVRFQEKNKVFHVQIEESKLGPHGEIVPGTSKWKKLNAFIYNAKKDSYTMKKGRNKVELTEEVDYKVLDLDNRAINLDKVKVRKGEAIVGVGLGWNDDDRAVEIQIVSRPFDLKTGQIEDPVDLEDEEVEIEWITWKNSPFPPKQYENERFEIGLANLDDPAKAPKNRPLSDPNDQIKVRATSFRKDMAQHTIPYLDFQAVTFSESKLPLRALQLLYKRAKGFGGFLAFKITTYDLAYSFQDQMTQEDVDQYKADFDEELPYDIPVKA